MKWLLIALAILVIALCFFLFRRYNDPKNFVSKSIVLNYDLQKGKTTVGEFVVPKGGLWLLSTEASACSTNTSKTHNLSFPSDGIKKFEQGEKVSIVILNNGQTIPKNTLKIEFVALELY